MSGPCHVCHEPAVAPVRVRLVVNDEASGYQGSYDLAEDQEVTMCASCLRAEVRNAGRFGSRHEPAVIYRLVAS